MYGPNTFVTLWLSDVSSTIVTSFDPVAGSAFLASLGAIEISREAYHRALEEALVVHANFHVWEPGVRISGRQALAAIED